MKFLLGIPLRKLVIRRHQEGRDIAFPISITIFRISGCIVTFCDHFNKYIKKNKKYLQKNSQRNVRKYKKI